VLYQRFEVRSNLGGRVARENWWEVARKRVGLGFHIANGEIRDLSLCSLTSFRDVLLVLKSGEIGRVVYARTNTRR
jgi:hypothetical protein